jgi:hypothetical protein
MPLPWRLLAGVALLLALALLALVLAYWGWRWFGPAAAVPPPIPAVGDPLQRIADARLFGSTAPKTAAPAPSSIGELRLLGVFAQRDGRGWALFRAGARGAIFVAAGSDVAPGLRLESVRPAGVTLLDAGVRRELALRAPPTTDKAKPLVASAAPKGTACAPPAGFVGPIVRLNAELLSGMINTPDTWKALVQADAGALVVRDQSGFAGMMSLKSGDRVERANGIALMIPDDIASSVLKPLTKSEQVWVSGTRDGKPQHWLYLNAGACPS